MTSSGTIGIVFTGQAGAVPEHPTGPVPAAILSLDTGASLGEGLGFLLWGYGAVCYMEDVAHDM